MTQTLMIIGAGQIRKNPPGEWVGYGNKLCNGPVATSIVPKVRPGFKLFMPAPGQGASSEQVGGGKAVVGFTGG
jgi:hypothetical protein